MIWIFSKKSHSFSQLKEDSIKIGGIYKKVFEEASIIIDLVMSYHMMGGSRPSYESMPPNFPNSYPPQPVYPPASTSIALFHIPNDATNSLYVDGIPNDAS